MPAMSCATPSARCWWCGTSVAVRSPIIWPASSSCGLLNQSHTRTMGLSVSFRFRIRKRGAARSYELRNRDTDGHYRWPRSHRNREISESATPFTAVSIWSRRSSDIAELMVAQLAEQSDQFSALPISQDVVRPACEPSDPPGQRTGAGFGRDRAHLCSPSRTKSRRSHRTLRTSGWRVTSPRIAFGVPRCNQGLDGP